MRYRGIFSHCDRLSDLSTLSSCLVRAISLDGPVPPAVFNFIRRKDRLSFKVRRPEARLKIISVKERSILSLARHVPVLTYPPPDQPQRQCRNILIYGSVSPIFCSCCLFNRSLAPASSRTRGVFIITLRYVSKSYHMTNSFLTNYATDSKNR